MNMERKQKISLALLRLSAIVFGVVTLLECGTAAVLWKNSISSAVSNSAAVIGGADGPTAIYITSGAFSTGLLLFLLALPPIFMVITLVLLYRRKRRNSGK